MVGVDVPEEVPNWLTVLVRDCVAVAAGLGVEDTDEVAAALLVSVRDIDCVHVVLRVGVAVFVDLLLPVPVEVREVVCVCVNDGDAVTLGLWDWLAVATCVSDGFKAGRVRDTLCDGVAAGLRVCVGLRDTLCDGVAAGLRVCVRVLEPEGERVGEEEEVPVGKRPMRRI